MKSPSVPHISSDFCERGALIFLTVFIAVNPFPHLTTIKEISLYSAFILASYSIAAKRRQLFLITPLTLPLVLFTLWAIIGLVFAMDPTNSLMDLFGHQLKYLLYYFLFINLFVRRKQLEIVVWVIIVSTAIYVFGGGIYYYGLKGISLSERFGFGFAEVTTNLIVVMTGSAFIYAIRLALDGSSCFKKVIATFFGILFLCITILTQSRAALLAISVAAILAFSKNWKLIITLMILLFMFILLSPLKSRFTEQGIGSIDRNVRISINLINLRVMLEHPIFGIGFSTDSYGKRIDFEAYNDKLPPSLKLPSGTLADHTKEPHNMYLSIGARTGIIGLLLFIYIMTAVIKMMLHILKHSRDSHLENWALCMLSSAAIFWIVGIFEQGLMHVTKVVFFTSIAIMTVIWKLTDNERPVG